MRMKRLNRYNSRLLRKIIFYIKKPILIIYSIDGESKTNTKKGFYETVESYNFIDLIVHGIYYLLI